jgi:spore maturation protein CgeB
MTHLRADAPLRLLLAGANPQEHKHDLVRRNDIAAGFTEVLGKSAVANCRYESVARQILRDRPELVLMVGSILPDRCDYAAMRKSCDQVDARLAFWLQYDPYEFDAYVKIVGLADFIFSNDRWATMHYPRTAVWHLPLAANPLRFGHEPLQPWQSRNCDVFFCGLPYPNRLQLLRDLSPTLRSHRTVVRGADWDAAEFPYCQNEYTQPEDLPALYASSRVVLNMGRNVSSVNNRCQLDASTPGSRTFEAAMAGSCQLLFTDSLEVMDHFEVGDEILLFDDAEDFRTQLEMVLADGERACSIGAAARRRAMRDHTYAARARTLLECVGLDLPKLHVTLPAREMAKIVHASA